MAENTINIPNIPGGSLPPVAATKSVSEIDSLRKLILDLKAKVDATPASPPAAAPTKKVDFSKLTERDIYNFDIPFEAVDQSVPDYMDIVLADSGYVPRWVNKNFKRMATILRMGWTYITKEDFSPEWAPLLPFDENGHYSCQDTVAVKIPKEKLYPIIRQNFLRSAALTDKNRIKTQVTNNWAHARGRSDKVEGMDSMLETAINLGGVQQYDPAEIGEK